MQVKLVINGEKVSADVAPDLRLLDFLRARGLKSVKCGCETSNCGLCTVWLDGRSVLSCSVVMGRADGHEVTTLEGLRAQSAEFARCMAEEGAEQCGFCSPGLVMNVMALRRDHLRVTDDLIRRYLANNLCRCTGYASQMRAVRRFLGTEQPAAVLAATTARPAASAVPAASAEPAEHNAPAISAQVAAPAQPAAQPASVQEVRA